MWVLLLSIAYFTGGGGVATADFASKALCVQAAQAFQTSQGQVKWLCAPKAAPGGTPEKPVSGGK